MSATNGGGTTMLWLTLIGCTVTSGERGPQGEPGPPGEAGLQGEPGPPGLPGLTRSLTFLGASSACPTLGSAEDDGFVEISNARSGTQASRVFGGLGDQPYNLGFEIQVTEPGVYRASLRGTWAASMSTEGVTMELLLACSGALVLHEERARMSLAVAGTSNVQVNTPFEAVTWLEVAEPTTLTCVLEKQNLDISSDGGDILFHSVCAPITTRLELSVALDGG